MEGESQQSVSNCSWCSGGYENFANAAVHSAAHPMDVVGRAHVGGRSSNFGYFGSIHIVLVTGKKSPKTGGALW